VFEDGRDGAGRRSVVLERPFEGRPAVVSSAGCGGGLKGDLLALGLTYVADVGSAVRVEADAEGVAETIGPALVIAGFANEGAGGRKRVVPGRVSRKIVAVDVDPEDLSEKLRQILRIVKLIVGPAAIPRRNIEESAVRTEDQRAAIVVGRVLMR